MDYFNFLPAEITIDILSRLPTESVLDSKLVCTDWRYHVRHPSFSQMHFHNLNHPSDSSGKLLGFIAITNDDKYHYIEYNDVIKRIRMINLTSQIRDSRFVGSCEGLICFAREPSVWICNPITREEFILPQIKRDYNFVYFRCWTIGFGYVSSTNEYKIVGIYTFEDKLVEGYIYTIGSQKGWRKLGMFNFKSPKEWGQGIYADGPVLAVQKLRMIKTFSLAEEKFCEHLSPPPFPQYGYVCDYRIGVSNESLSFDIDLFVHGAMCYDIWLLKKKIDNPNKKEGEEHRSLDWSKKYRFQKTDKLLTVTKSGGALTYGDYYLNIYDSKTSTFKRLVKFKSRLLQISLHRSTLVSLKDIGEEQTKTMQSIGIEEAISRDYSFKLL